MRVRLPQWRWLDRFDHWRLERGILTGRWTKAEVDNQRRRARERHELMQRAFAEDRMVERFGPDCESVEEIFEHHYFYLLVTYRDGYQERVHVGIV